MLRQWGDAVAEFGGKAEHWLFYNDYIYRGIDFTGRSVIDVGGGVGRAAYYAAAAGASRVVCVEPEADGSRNTMLDTAAKLGDRLGLRDRVEFITKPLEDVGDIGRFDIVLCHNCINHLDEAACSRLHVDAEARRRYLHLLQDFDNISAPGARLVVTDCSRRNLFGDLGIYNPFAPSITWRIHQTPELWAELFASSGFTDPVIRWTPDRRSGRFGERFLTSPLAAYCLQSHFCLTMVKGRPDTP